MSKIGTVALVVHFNPDQTPTLVEALSDDHEIALLESAIKSGDTDPLALIHDLRVKKDMEESQFGDYVEEILEKPFVRHEIRDQGVQWFKSKIKIEHYQRCEAEATKVIADFAFKIFQDDCRRDDFFLAGPSSKVRVRIFRMPEENKSMRVARA